MPIWLTAYTGTGIYKGKKYEKRRLLFGGVAPGTFHIVTLANSKVKSFPDLKGKKVAVGPQGGGVKFRLLEMTDAERDKLVQKFPYYNKVDLPTNVYGLPAVLKLAGSANVVSGLSDHQSYL